MAATSVTDIFRLDADNSDRQAIKRRGSPALSWALRLPLTVLRQSTGEPRPMAKYGASRSSAAPVVTVGWVDTGYPPPREATAAIQAPGDSESAGQPASPASPARLAFASFLMLFVELALIRWVGAKTVFVNDATNFVLLARFPGIG